MAEYKDREHFIPLRRSDLVELLCGDKELSPEDRFQFRQFCRLVTATYHYEYNQRLEELKDAYAPFDPDADTRPLRPLDAAERQQRLDQLFQEFSWLLERANFKPLTPEELSSTLHTRSDWGLQMDVDFDVFERIALFVRGDTMQKRSRRRLRRLYLKEEIHVPTYQRLVGIIKLRPHRRLDRKVDTNPVYLKIFKDIPKLDVKMLLPGSRLRFTALDRGKVGFPLLSGLGLALWKIVSEVVGAGLRLVDDLFAWMSHPSLALWGLATGALGYGYKSYYGYQTTKQRYHLTLTQSLYYLNLDSNCGVLMRLLDEAEEQECREAILAYYFLWRHGGAEGWTSADLDDYVELYLERYAGLKVDFEIGDALAKLEKLRIVERVGDRYRAQPLAKALEMLDWTWDNYFKYNNPEPEVPPIA